MFKDIKKILDAAEKHGWSESMLAEVLAAHEQINTYAMACWNGTPGRKAPEALEVLNAA